MDQVMDIVKLHKFKGVEEFGQQNENLDCGNRKQEHKVEILKDPNDVLECTASFYFPSISKEK